MSKKPTTPDDEDDPNAPKKTALPAKEKRRFGRWTIIIGAVVVLFVCGSIVNLFTGDAADDTEPTAEVAGQVVATEEPAETELPEPTDAPEPTSTPAPTDTPAPPTPTLEPAEALHAAVADALGSGNRDVERLVRVEDKNGRIEVDWAINDALGEEWTRGAAQLDATNILRAVAESGYAYEFILLRGTFSMVDQFGNAEEMKVVELFFERPTVEKIDFDNFDHRNVYEIADSAEIHPAFVRE